MILSLFCVFLRALFSTFFPLIFVWNYRCSLCTMSVDRVKWEKVPSKKTKINVNEKKELTTTQDEKQMRDLVMSNIHVRIHDSHFRCTLGWFAACASFAHSLSQSVVFMFVIVCICHFCKVSRIKYQLVRC